MSCSKGPDTKSFWGSWHPAPFLFISNLGYRPPFSRDQSDEWLQSDYARDSTGDDRYFYAENLVKGLTVRGPNQVWVADITYIRLLQEFVFLAVVLDIFSRRVVGWAISKQMHVELTLAALKMAILARKPKSGCIHHSDRGGQYASERYVAMLEKVGLRPSMSRPGYPYDNAYVESFIKTLKQEEVNCSEYKNLDDLTERIPHFIEKVYNEERLHSKIGYLAPVEYEQKPRKWRPSIYVTIN